MAAKRQPKPAGKKPPARTRKMVILDPVMARRLAALAAWQGRSESSIVAEALRPILADVAVTGGPARPQTAEPSPAPAAALSVVHPQPETDAA